MLVDHSLKTIHHDIPAGLLKAFSGIKRKVKWFVHKFRIRIIQKNKGYAALFISGRLMNTVLNRYIRTKHLKSLLKRRRFAIGDLLIKT